MEPSLTKLILRRLKQIPQILTSPDLVNPNQVTSSTTSRYDQVEELKFYTELVSLGLEDCELSLINLALQKTQGPLRSALVVGCGAGREVFALEQMGLKAQGLDLSENMISAARKIAKERQSTSEFTCASVFEINQKHYDIIYISPAINGHIATRRERVRFYRKLNNLCTQNSLLITMPEIKPLVPKSSYYWASQALRLRHLLDQDWEPGDTAKSFLGNHSESEQMLFYHYYPSETEFLAEMSDAGFARVNEAGNYMFTPNQKKAFAPKITHVAKYYPPEIHGGMESLLFDLTSNLAQRGFEVETIVASKESQSNEIVSGVEVKKNKCFGEIASTPISLSYLQSITNVKSDLIHVHLPNPLALGVGLQAHTPLLISYHCDVLSYPKLYAFYRPLMEKQLDRATKIVVSSPHLIESSPVLKKFKSKCVVIPFGIDRHQFKIKPNTQQSIRELKNIYGKPMLLFVGRLVKYKGLDYLLQAMTEIDAILTIVGSGPELSTLRRLVDQYGLYEKVHFMGEVERTDLGAYYSECDLFVLPSIDQREAFGICLIEAFAFGKSVVTTNLGTGVNFVNVDGKTGVCVPPKNIDALKFEINNLINNPERRLEFGNNAFARYQQLFTLGPMIEKYHQLYEDILGYELMPDITPV